MTALPLLDGDDNVVQLTVKPSASFMAVDPDTARRWLGRNTHNRTVRQRVVNAYVRDLKAGEWRLTGEAVKFAKDGTLLDGQHRLLAIVEADVTATTLVVRGLDPEVQDVMDTGSKRTAADILILAEYDNAPLLAAAAKWAVLYDTNRLYVDRTNRSVTHADIRSYVEDNALLLESTRFAASLRNQIDLPPSLLATAVYLTSRVDRDASEEFFARLADGVGLRRGDPILALRSRLREIAQRKQRVEPEAFLSLVLRAWNARRAGRQLASIPIYRAGVAIRCPEPR
jgi:hypothetical protein